MVRRFGILLVALLTICWACATDPLVPPADIEQPDPLGDPDGDTDQDPLSDEDPVEDQPEDPDGDEDPDEPEPPPLPELTIAAHLETSCGLFPFTELPFPTTIVLECLQLDDGPPVDRMVWNKVSGDRVIGTDVPNLVRFENAGDGTVTLECTASRGNDTFKLDFEVPLEQPASAPWVFAGEDKVFAIDRDAFEVELLESDDDPRGNTSAPGSLLGMILENPLSCGDDNRSEVRWRCVSGPTGSEDCELVKMIPVAAEDELEAPSRYRIQQSLKHQLALSGTGEAHPIALKPLAGLYTFELSRCFDCYGEVDLVSYFIAPKFTVMEAGSNVSVLHGMVASPGQPVERSVSPGEMIEIRFHILTVQNGAAVIVLFGEETRDRHVVATIPVAPLEPKGVEEVAVQITAPDPPDVYAMGIAFSSPGANVREAPAGITIIVR